MRDANRLFHDRIAARYDDVYGKDPYWEFYFQVSWEDMKASLPRDLDLPVLDAGCGTGRYGLKLLKSGYRVVFSDLSPKMVERALLKAGERGDPERFEGVVADLETLEPFADESFRLVVAQGDPLGFCGSWARGLDNVRRVLVPQGRAVLSVDSRYGGIDPFLARGDLEGLERFLADGQGTWLAQKAEERFPFHAFTPDELERGAERAGLRVVRLIGKTVCDLRGRHDALEDPATRRRLLALEKRYGATPLALGRAHHLQLTVERPAPGETVESGELGAGRPPRRRRGGPGGRKGRRPRR